MKTVFLLRHADFTLPPDGQVPDSTPLNAAGHARARAVALLLARAGVTAIFASQAARTQQTASGLAQQKAEIQARSGRCFHPGGSFGGGTHEGVGFSTVSADDAVRHCCYWGQRTPIDIGVARGANGWYTAVIYR